MVNDRLSAYLFWSACPGIGTVNFKKIVDAFGSAEEGWRAPVARWEEVVGTRLATMTASFRRSFNPDIFLQRLNSQAITVLTIEDELYPEKLKSIDGAPFLLYLKSSAGADLKELFQKPAVAVVGSRKITSYGRQITDQLVADLVTAGVVIVSGMMYGVDETSHRMAITAGGQTVGVWAGGIDTLWGTSRESLTNTILGNKSVIVSEFPLGLTPTPGLFPARNRIVSGLASAVIVVEATLESGSLITAGHAASQGREVFAVPGPVTSSQSLGTARLIQQGASLITGAREVLAYLGLADQLPKKQSCPGNLNLNDDETKIVEILKNENKHIDELVRQTGWNTGKLTSVLSLMEVKGLVQNLGGMVYGLA